MWPRDWAAGNTCLNDLICCLRVKAAGPWFLLCVPSPGSASLHRCPHWDGIPGRQRTTLSSVAYQLSGPDGILKHRKDTWGQPFLNSAPGPDTTCSQSAQDQSAFEDETGIPASSLTHRALALRGTRDISRRVLSVVPISCAYYVRFPFPRVHADSDPEKMWECLRPC